MRTPQSYYRAHLFFCLNQRDADHPTGCCARHGDEILARYLKQRIKELKLKRVRVNTAGCLHRCRLAPVMVIYPEGIWYTFSTEADLDEILESHLVNGVYVSRLLLPDRPQDEELEIKESALS